MPEPEDGETKEEFMGRCIPMVLKDGAAKDEKQAAAICYSKWEKKDEKAVEIPLDIENTVVAYGDAVKALPGGKVGGYLVRFTAQEDTDLTGEYFDKETDLGEPVRLPVVYHHGLDETLKRRKIGMADTKVDDVGLWVEAQLSLRDEYEQSIYQMAKDGKLGWSSGAAAHVTDKAPTGKGVHITQWYIAEASLTPAPAEPRNSVITLKSYMSANTAPKNAEGEAEAVKTAQSEAGQDKAETTQPSVANATKENLTMEITPELQTLLDAVSDKSAIKAAKEAVKEFRESEPAVKTADVVVVTDEADNALKGGWKYPGEFFMAVKNAALYPAGTDKRLLPLKAAAGQGVNETIPSQGGFLVDQSIAPGIMERMYDQGTLLGQFATDAIGPNSNGMTYHAVDETSRADGSRWGGIRGYWLPEAGTKTASQPTFRNVELKLKKAAALCYATDEMLEDSTALAGWLNRTVPQELRFLVEAAILNGSGAGQPLGIRKSGAFIEEPRTAAALAALTAAEVIAVWARRWGGAKDYIWLVDPSLLPPMMGLTVGNFPVFMPANGLQGTPAATLFGRPVFEVEYLPTYTATTGIMGLMLIAPSQCVAIDKGGIQSASSIHVSFATDETAFRFVYRYDFAPLWTTALTPYSGGETVSPYVALGSTSS